MENSALKKYFEHKDIEMSTASGPAVSPLSAESQTGTPEHPMAIDEAEEVEAAEKLGRQTPVLVELFFYIETDLCRDGAWAQPSA